MISIVEQAMDPVKLFSDFQESVDLTQSGACTQFTGFMRDFNTGDDVHKMTLEYYPGMTEKSLEKIESEARDRWPLNAVLIVHRVGDLKPADPIVLVAVWSAHRNEAFEACRFLIEELKHRAPFWKKETTGEGDRWVAENTPAE